MTPMSNPLAVLQQVRDELVEVAKRTLYPASSRPEAAPIIMVEPAEVARWISVLSALIAEDQAPLPAVVQADMQRCVECGAYESADGDWYRLCGPCRWGEIRATPEGESASRSAPQDKTGR